MATTSRWALRYPVGSDTADVPLWMGRLASDLDAVAMDDQGLLANRPDSSVGNPGKRGRYFYATNGGASGTGGLYRDNGTGWDEIAIERGQSAAVGDYKTSAQTADHTGWLLCDGRSSILRSAYPALYALIGADFGAGDDGTKFRIPDFRGRVFAGADPSGLRIAGSPVRGAAGGAETVTLSESQMPAHNHDIGSEDAGGGTFTEDSGSVVAGIGGGANTTLQRITNGTFFTRLRAKSKGGGGSHNNMPPYIVGGSVFIKT